MNTSTPSSKADLSVRKLIPISHMAKTANDNISSLIMASSPSLRSPKKKHSSPAKQDKRQVKVLQTMVETIHSNNNNESKSSIT